MCLNLPRAIQLGSKRSERDTIRGVQIRAGAVYIYIKPVVKVLSSFTGIYVLDIVPRIVAAGIKLI